MLSPFANEPVLELRRAAVRASLSDALAVADSQLPLSVGVMIGEDTRSGEELISTDPGTPSRVVAQCATGGEADVQAAISQARDGLRVRRATGPEDRAAALVAAAAWMRRRRLELAALEVRECAKPWLEADGDVCEAIDFLEYYARAAIELGRGRELLQVPGERMS